MPATCRRLGNELLLLCSSSSSAEDGTYTLPFSCAMPFPAPSSSSSSSPNPNSSTNSSSSSSESETLVARTGRVLQRYEDGVRLVAGCIPYRILTVDGRVEEAGSDASLDKRDLHESRIQVLMISSQHGEGLLFPKGGWESDETVEEAACREALEEAGVKGVIQDSLGTFDFRSKSQRNEKCREGFCRAHIFSLSVTLQLEHWPEQDRRKRYWMSLPEALERCRHDWMRLALQQWRERTQLLKGKGK